jgi:2,3,4,5-tetrahydropyridine-2-carboxylate N-succinyltransferase
MRASSNDAATPAGSGRHQAVALDPPAEDARGDRGALRRSSAAGADFGTSRRGGWSANSWVKQGILLAFRCGVNADLDVPPVFRFRDRDTLFPGGALDPTVRVVPGGTTVRRGAHLGRGVVVMPPAFVNVGAYVGEATMIDSHALVGSCAQVGARVHVSAAAQIGGVLEPIGAVPVVIEDDVFVGGGAGVYEGTWVRAGAVLAAGVIVTRSMQIVDLVREKTAAPEIRLIPGEVVVPGARGRRAGGAAAHGVFLQTPVIVKYRDAATDAISSLEEALR